MFSHIKSIEDIHFFVIFFVPGFVILKVYYSFVANEKINFSQAIYEVVAFSCITYIIALPVIHIYHKFITGSFAIDIFLLFCYAFVLPCLLVVSILGFSKTKFFRKFQILELERTAWDYIFSKRKCMWVVVTLKSGKIIAGNFKSASYSSAFPHKDIYIEEIWKMRHGAFSQKVNRTAGIYISESEISTIEFINH